MTPCPTCGNANVHTPDCRRQARRQRYYAKRKQVRAEKRRKHICTYSNCSEVIKPVMTYPQFCPRHKPKLKPSGGMR
jgi:hypothetical protein